jgi:hypothetical protein
MALQIYLLMSIIPFLLISACSSLPDKAYTDSTHPFPLKLSGMGIRLPKTLHVRPLADHGCFEQNR